ncbi:MULTISPECIES: hypothetical protein [Streptomyces]|uniref:hypothetical protein n=1 Tax=Streptomyces TaxID=1883 RepID=UPI0004CD14D9|nr:MULTISPECIES: hypothetical protein [Streptomyces]
MSPQPLPDPQHQYGGQQLPGWPVEAPLSGPVELYGEHDPVVYTVDAYGQPVAMRRSQVAPVQPTPPRDLSPQPVLDPLAQRLLGGGIGGGALAAGVGWGAAQIVDAATAAGAGLIGWAILIVLLLKTSRRGGDTYNINQTVHASTKWFGRTDIDLH